MIKYIKKLFGSDKESPELYVKDILTEPQIQEAIRLKDQRLEEARELFNSGEISLTLFRKVSNECEKEELRLNRAYVWLIRNDLI